MAWQPVTSSTVGVMREGLGGPAVCDDGGSGQECTGTIETQLAPQTVNKMPI